MKYTNRHFLLIILISSLVLGSFQIFSPQQKIHTITSEPHISAPNTFKAAWYRTWGGGSRDDCFFCESDLEGNFYLAGQTLSFGSGGVDIFILKYNKNGVLQWNHTWGGTDKEKLYSIAVDSANNVYLGGFANVTSGIPQSFLISFDTDGQLRWDNTWSGIETYNPWHIVCDSLNNIYVGGSQLDDGILLQFNVSGELQWNRTWGGSDFDGTDSICLDSLNNIYVAGITGFAGLGTGDGILLKYNITGGFQWNRTWGTTENDFTFRMTSDSFNNIYVAGSLNHSTERILLKYDTSGVQLWNRTGGKIEEGFIEINDMELDSSGGILLAGRIINLPAYRTGLWLYKFDNTGTEQWFDMWENEQNEQIMDIKLDSSNNLFAVGKTSIASTPLLSYQYDIYLLKYDNLGALISNSSWGGEESDTPCGLVLDSSQNIFVGGTTGSYGAKELDVCLIKFAEKKPSSIFGFNVQLLILFIGTFSIILVISQIRKQTIP